MPDPNLAVVELISSQRPGDPPASRVKHKRQSKVGRPDDVFGERAMSSGEHRIVYIIESQSASGCGLALGVASADGKLRWGVRSSDGRAITYPSRRSSESGRVVMLASSAVPGSQERAVSRRVEVIVDMARRRLRFSVDGCAQLTQRLTAALLRHRRRRARPQPARARLAMASSPPPSGAAPPPSTPGCCRMSSRRRWSRGRSSSSKGE